jgi:hypothetical protein
MEGALSGRPLAPVDASDLVRLAGIAAEAEARLFARHPRDSTPTARTRQRRRRQEKDRSVRRTGGQLAENPERG